MPVTWLTVVTLHDSLSTLCVIALVSVTNTCVIKKNYAIYNKIQCNLINIITIAI